MCYDVTCVPYCAQHIDDPNCEGWVYRHTRPEAEEMCVNVEYDLGGKHNEKNFCVDVVGGDTTNATDRLNKLLDGTKAKEGWQNDKYYCMYGLARFFMSNTSVNYSDQYCGKPAESTKADRPATNPLVEARDNFLRAYYRDNNLVSAFNAQSLSPKR